MLCTVSYCRVALIASDMSMGGVCPQADKLIELAGTTLEDQLCMGPTHWSRTYFSGVLMPTESSPLSVSFVEVIGWHFNMVLRCPLGPLRRFRPRSAGTCVLPRAYQHELQSNLQMAATCARLRGAQERPSCKIRLAATSATA
ncbi:hypothetical protein HJG60_010487 [Phyllostomus discolor]|uniref:Uncharacterized protein n=1 Tax=Phyllostomus discolor TaxID=89673 RepID=A0A834AL90_9CHIR|nr:hypothetical protein HJG60_010487 [Phyllostomus discolor]